MAGGKAFNRRKPVRGANTSPEVSRPAASPYILSARADGLFIVGAALLCPALILPISGLTSPFAVWSVVMTFGAVGHHLPSFLRTYGDREIFRRYRARLLLAPPLFFAATLWFTMKGLHGMLLISMCWSIWHGMMQHFGFMRIYDHKVGAADAKTARLDWWISACWFGLILVLSPNQGGSLLDLLYDGGIPLVPLSLIKGLRVVLIAVTAVVTLLYLEHAVRGDQKRSRLKLMLLVGTFVYIWLVRVVLHDPYLSVALFEVLHVPGHRMGLQSASRRQGLRGPGDAVALSSRGDTGRRLRPDLSRLWRDWPGGLNPARCGSVQAGDGGLPHHLGTPAFLL